MTINQLTNKTSILKDDLLLISEGSIDYKCTAKDLIFNSLSTFNGLTLGSESNYVNGVFTNGLSVAGTIDFRGNPNFNVTLGSSARPIWINNYPEAVTASGSNTVLACTGNDVNNSSSYNWLKYSSEDKANTLIYRDSNGAFRTGDATLKTVNATEEINTPKINVTNTVNVGSDAADADSIAKIVLDSKPDNTGLVKKTSRIIISQGYTGYDGGHLKGPLTIDCETLNVTGQPIFEWVKDEREPSMPLFIDGNGGALRYLSPNYSAVLAFEKTSDTSTTGCTWLKYSADELDTSTPTPKDTLVLRTKEGNINATTFNGYTLGGTGDKGIPSSDSVNTAIESAKQGAITASKVDNTVKSKDNTGNYYLLGVDSKDPGQVRSTITYDNLYIEMKSDGAWLRTDYVVNAVWNDIADYLNVDKDLEIIYGRAYTRDPKTNKVRLAQKNERAIGLASDTCGFQLGKNDKEHQIPIALGGWILAYTDKNYKPGTLLKVGKKGILTKASKLDEIFNPSRIIASFDRVEKEETWHGKVVDGRNWVKIK